MPLTLPATTKSLGSTVVAVLTTAPAAGSGIPTVTEINAGKFITCHLYDDMSTLFVPTQNTGQAPRKACTKVVPTALGTVTYAEQEIQYSYGPQALGTPGNAANVAYEALAPGSTVTLVQLNGLSGTNSTVSASQVANIYKVDVGVYMPTSTGNGEYDEFSVKQKMVLSASVGGQPVAMNTVLA